MDEQWYNWKLQLMWPLGHVGLTPVMWPLWKLTCTHHDIGIKQPSLSHWLISYDKFNPILFMYIWIIFNLPQVLQGIYFLLIHDIYISGFPRIGQRKCLCLSFLALQELNPHAQGVTLQELNPHAQGVTLAAVFNCIIVRPSAYVNHGSF
jgi:hypothetical protein